MWKCPLRREVSNAKLLFNVFSKEFSLPRRLITNTHFLGRKALDNNFAKILARFHVNDFKKRVLPLFEDVSWKVIRQAVIKYNLTTKMNHISKLFVEYTKVNMATFMYLYPDTGGPKRFVLVIGFHIRRPRGSVLRNSINR